MASYSAAIAEFVTKLRFKDLPREVVEKCKMQLLDTLGIGLKASATGSSKMIYRFVEEQGGRPQCSLIGLPKRTSPLFAAFLNGSLIHGLDYDDTHSAAIVHVSTTVVPPALALGEAGGVTGKGLITAIVAGYEVAIRAGLTAPGEFHKRGYHATSICGIFGAAASAGKVLGLKPAQISNALGLCGSQSSGIQEFLNDGSWNKKIHPGWAALGAITSVELARQGFIGSGKIFEGRFGLYNSHVGSENFHGERLTDGLNKVWETMNISIKPYPCCHYLHAFIDGALLLKEKHKIRPEEIDSVECLISAAQAEIVCKPIEMKQTPATPYGALFSLPYSVAMALVNDKVRGRDFFDVDVNDKNILRLSKKVGYSIDPESDYPRHFPGMVKIRMKSGETFEYRERFNRGCPENPLSRDEVIGKFTDNVSGILRKDKAERLAEKIFMLEKVPDISEVMAICRIRR